MTKIEYTIERSSVYGYQLELLRSGRCSALLPGSCYEEDGNVHIVCDLSGTVSLFEMLGSDGTQLLSGFRSLLRALRRIIEAAYLAEGYLVEESKLSFAAEDIYFGADDGKARLLLKPGCASLADAAEQLCEEIRMRCPDVNADMLSSRIRQEAEKGKLGSERMLRLLSSWEFELSDGPEHFAPAR